MRLAMSVSPATLVVEPLSAKAFAPFGHVIENPGQAPMHGEHIDAEPVEANQGTALKYVDISPIHTFYEAAPSRCKARAVMNMFVCSPRPLRPLQVARGDDDTNITSVAGPQPGAGFGLLGLFDLTLMERHPYTTQTFIPVGLDSGNTEAAYLVVVAPTLPACHDGAGLPDVTGIKAFFARGSQAVTYGAATWHSPMIVVGGMPISFIVTQYSNAVAEEDCEEIELTTTTGREGITIAVPLRALVVGKSRGPKL